MSTTCVVEEVRALSLPPTGVHTTAMINRTLMSPAGDELVTPPTESVELNVFRWCPISVLHCEGWPMLYTIYESCVLLIDARACSFKLHIFASSRCQPGGWYCLHIRNDCCVACSLCHCHLLLSAGSLRRRYGGRRRVHLAWGQDPVGQGASLGHHQRAERRERGEARKP